MATVDTSEAEPDSIARFAADLRSLRLEADSPTLARLQNETGISRTVLSDAFRGIRLPSVRTVDRIVRACGEDPAVWIRRRDRLARERQAVPSDPVPGEGADDASAPSPADVAEADETGAASRAPKLVRRSVAVWIAVGAFVVGCAVTGIVGSAVTVGAESATAGAPLAEQTQIAVTTGLDPALTPCVDDAQVATSESRDDGRYLLEIVWSDACQAGWGRVTRYDAQARGNTLSVSTYPEPDPVGPQRQNAVEADVQSAYTMLVVRPTPGTRICALGSATVGDSAVDLGGPLCT